jgi:YVTN family beta-propeller protein
MTRHLSVRWFATTAAMVFPQLVLADDARLLVLSKAESTLAIVDPATLKVTATVPTGLSPHEVCVSADGKTAFVADYGANLPGSTLTVIDLVAAKPLRRVDLGPLKRPHGLAEHAGKIYFTSEIAAAVGRYDPTKDAVDLIVGTGMQGSHMLVVDPTDGRVYTTNIGSDTVSMLDPQRAPGGAALTAHVSVAGQPEAIALAPDGRELWVAPRARGPISIINTAADVVTHTIPFDGAAIRLTFTPDGTRVLASDVPNQRVVIFDAKERKPLAEVKMPGVPVGSTVQPDGARAFVSCASVHKVAVIDLKTNEIVGEIDAGAVPDGIAFAAPRAAVAAAPRTPGLFGGQLENLTPADRERLKLDPGTGIRLAEASPNLPAAKAGLVAGDVIVSVNGASVANTQRFVRMLSRHNAGDELLMKVIRDGAAEPIEAKVTLAPRPSQ